MKKYFLTFLIFLCSFSQIYAAGDEMCVIQNGPSEELVQYIQSNRQVIINLKNIISQKVTDQTGQTSVQQIKEQVTQDGKKVSRIFNTIATWDGYFSYFQYYVTYPLLNDVPYEVKRDHTLLLQEGEGLNNYLQNVITKGYTNFPITNEEACKGNKEIQNCPLSGTVSSIMGQLIQNHNKILDSYRKIVMQKSFSPPSLILVNESTFISNLTTHYGFTPNCTQWNTNRIEQIKAAVKGISLTNSGSKAGIKEWKDARDLARGINTPEKEDIERNLLIQEAGRLGLPGNGAASMVKNLDKYNNAGGISISNNIIVNTIVNTMANFWENIEDESKRFHENVIGDFQEKRKKNQKIEGMSIQGLQAAQSENDRTTKISKNIAEIYFTQLPFTEKSENNTDKLRARIMKLHDNLNESIKILNETAKISSKVCNAQDKGKGDCNPK